MTENEAFTLKLFLMFSRFVQTKRIPISFHDALANKMEKEFIIKVLFSLLNAGLF